MALEPGRLTRAAIHSHAGDVELRLSLAGSWVLAVRRDGEREWQVACSGDLNGGAHLPAASPEPDALRFGKLLIDANTHSVFVSSARVGVSRLEFALLSTLAVRPNHVFGKRELLKAIWGYEGIDTRTLDSHASRLRVKLRRAGAPGFILNTRQIGYRLWDGVG